MLLETDVERGMKYTSPKEMVKVADKLLVKHFQNDLRWKPMLTWDSESGLLALSFL